VLFNQGPVEQRVVLQKEV